MEAGAASRLSMRGHISENCVEWPPRFSHMVGGAQPLHLQLKRTGKVQSWTTLSAAGAPSEFSLRAPILGGISTVFLALDDGPNGVFLTVDDEEPYARDGRWKWSWSFVAFTPKKALYDTG